MLPGTVKHGRCGMFPACRACGLVPARLWPQGSLSAHGHELLVVPQRCVPQDPGFSSLFLKVLMQILQWLESPAGEGGPLQAQLKLFASQYSARRRISDGEGQEPASRLLLCQGDGGLAQGVCRLSVGMWPSGLVVRALGSEIGS